MNREEAIPFLSTARAGEIGILEFCGCKTETLWIWNLRAGAGVGQIPREEKSKATLAPLCVSSSTPRSWVSVCGPGRRQEGGPCCVAIFTQRHGGRRRKNSLVLREAVNEGLNSRDGSEPRTLEDGRSSPSLE